MSCMCMSMCICMSMCWNLSVANNKSLGVCFICFPEHARACGVWLIFTPRALRSQEAAVLWEASGVLSKGCLVKSKIKNYTVFRNSPALCQTTPKNSPLTSWDLGF